MRLPDGRWRIYISSATPGTKHWKVDAIDADHPSLFDAAMRVTVLPGDDKTAVKDPVIKLQDDVWHIWLCCHPLSPPRDADRMSTRYGTSTDGLTWNLGPTVLSGRADMWDERGARVADVHFIGDQIVAYYDGCETASQDTEEFLGIADGTVDSLESVSDSPIVLSGYATGSVRYPAFVTLPDGSQRLYYEAARADGAHDLLTELIPPL